MSQNAEQRAKDRAWYLKELRSDECFCGREKDPGKSFCWRCYKRLPRDLQAALYGRIGNGYEGAYDEAAEWMEE